MGSSGALGPGEAGQGRGLQRAVLGAGSERGLRRVRGWREREEPPQPRQVAAAYNRLLLI